MIRKSLIALCLLASLATLALWADSFRPRYTCRQLEDDLTRVKHTYHPEGYPKARIAELEERLGSARYTNTEPLGLTRGFHGYSLELTLWRRVVPVDDPDRRWTDSYVHYGPYGAPYTPGTLRLRCVHRVRSQLCASLLPTNAYFWHGSWLWLFPAGWELAFPAVWLSAPPFAVAGLLSIKPLRRYRRRRRGLCVKCAYDLRGTASDRCPECGTGIPRPAAGGT